MAAECGKHGLWTGASCPGLLFAYGRELQLVIFRVPVQAPVQCCSEAGVGALNSVCPSQGLRGEGGSPPPPGIGKGFVHQKMERSKTSFEWLCGAIWAPKGIQWSQKALFWTSGGGIFCSKSEIFGLCYGLIIYYVFE